MFFPSVPKGRFLKVVLEIKKKKMCVLTDILCQERGIA